MQYSAAATSRDPSPHSSDSAPTLSLSTRALPLPLMLLPPRATPPLPLFPVWSLPVAPLLLLAAEKPQSASGPSPANCRGTSPRFAEARSAGASVVPCPAAAAAALEVRSTAVLGAARLPPLPQVPPPAAHSCWRCGRPCGCRCWKEARGWLIRMPATCPGPPPAACCSTACRAATAGSADSCCPCSARWRWRRQGVRGGGGGA